jgi:hypothetical protein
LNIYAFCSCLNCSSTSFFYFRLLGPDEPQLPLKLVHPFQEVETFDRNVSNKIHKNLVTKLHSSKDKSLVAARLMSDSKKPICPLLTNEVIVAVMNAKTDTLSKVAVPVIPWEADDVLTIVSGTGEKWRILKVYEEKFGSGYPDSIVMSKKGKLVSLAGNAGDMSATCRPNSQMLALLADISLSW